MPEKTEITVAVCTYNRSMLLRQAVESLFNLKTRRHFEIVIVDNASNDDTHQVISELAKNTPVPVRCFLENRPGVAFARNRAVSEAHGQWIAFFDDDQIAHPDWLDQLLCLAIKKNAKCVGGRVKLLFPESVKKAPPAICRAMLNETPDRRICRYTRRWWPSTANILIHRSVFHVVGMFDESYAEGGEDSDFYVRLHASGFDAWYTPDAVVHHIITEYRTEKRYLLKIARRYGWITARIEQKTIGTVALPVICTARFVRSFLAFLPGRGYKSVPDLGERMIEFKCLLHRALGYAQYALSAVAHPRISRDRFVKNINFRAEREILKPGPEPKRL